MKKITVEYIRKEIERIKEKRHDPEYAHSIEDDLHITVLKAISNRADNPKELASEALKTEDLDFERWCA